MLGPEGFWLRRRLKFATRRGVTREDRQGREAAVVWVAGVQVRAPSVETTVPARALGLAWRRRVRGWEVRVPREPAGRRW